MDGFVVVDAAGSIAFDCAARVGWVCVFGFFGHDDDNDGFGSFLTATWRKPFDQ